MANLRELATTWQNEDGISELPNVLYEALTEGGSGYEKRVIRSMAKVSRIIKPDGSIRLFDDFREDWQYSHSTFGRTSTCEACGKQHIVQNCVLIDEEQDKRELVVGNTCVFRYLEIEVDGVILEGQEKEEYLRNQMNEAKKEFKRQQFVAEYPDALDLLKKYEPVGFRFMAFRVNAKTEIGDHSTFMDMTRPNRNGKLLRSIGKRLAKFGYLGPQMKSDFDQFMTIADTLLEEFTKTFNETIELRKIQAEQNDARKAHWAAQREERIATQKAESDEWVKSIEPIFATFDNWEKEAADTIRVKLLNGQNLGGLNKFALRVKARLDIHNGVESDNEEVQRIEALNGANQWEKDFIASVAEQLRTGKTVSPKQQKIITRISGSKLNA